MENEKKLNPKREVVKKIISMASGWGAEILIGTVAFGVVKTISDVSKPMKVLLYAGASGLGILTAKKTMAAVEEYCDDVFDCIDMIKEMFPKKEPVKANTTDVTVVEVK